jgi:hypothetical protein
MQKNYHEPVRFIVIWKCRYSFPFGFNLDTDAIFVEIVSQKWKESPRLFKRRFIGRKLLTTFIQ